MSLIFLGLLMMFGVWLITTYNRFIQLKVRCDNAWSDIDVQLKRRHDLVPNLVSTVEGYVKHERGTLQSVTEARNQALGGAGVADKARLENALSGALKSLFAVAENYPDLKANASFLQLQRSLSEIEDTIQSARRYFNAVVRDFNILAQTFPSNILAGMFRFPLREFFQLEAAAERQNPKVEIKS